MLILLKQHMQLYLMIHFHRLPLHQDLTHDIQQQQHQVYIHDESIKISLI